MAGPEVERMERLNGYWDAVVRGTEAEGQEWDPELAETVQALRALDDAPAPDPAFGRQLWQELMEEEIAPSRPDSKRTAAPRLRPAFRLRLPLGRWPFAYLGAAVLAVLLLGVYLVAMRPAPVSAEEIVRKALETAASPTAGGIKSFVASEKTASRPGNPRMNGYAGYTGDEQILTETNRWYSAPDRWRIDSSGITLDPQGKEMPNRNWHWISVSDGKAVWRYDARANSVTVSEFGVSPSGQTDSYGAESTLGQGTIDPQKALQTTNPNVRPKLQGEETVAGRKAYVLAFPSETRSASAPEINGPRTVWIDEETFFVLRVVQYSGIDGKLLSTTEVTSIQYNVTIDPALFTFAPPSGAKVDDQRPKPAPTKSQFQQQMEALAKQADFPIFLPSLLPNGLVPRQPRTDDSLGLQVEYVPPSEADKSSFPTLRVTEQKATYDLVSRWTEGAEGADIGNAKGWLRRGFRNVDGTGGDSAAMVLKDGALVSVASFTLSPEELVKVAASLEPVPGGHTPLPNPSVSSMDSRPTPTPVPAPKFTLLRPTWLPEPMTSREQYQPDPTGKGSEAVIGFDPRPVDTNPHGVLMLTEMSKGAMPTGLKPDPEETHETIGGRDVAIISRGENWITMTWVQGEIALILTNPYDPPGHPRYTPDQLRRIIESIH